jgi:hypothetical protein
MCRIELWSIPTPRIELLQLDRSGIRVASYRTDLPPGQLLQRKLHETIIAA